MILKSNIIKTWKIIRYFNRASQRGPSFLATAHKSRNGIRTRKRKVQTYVFTTESPLKSQWQWYRLSRPQTTGTLVNLSAHGICIALVFPNWIGLSRKNTIRNQT